MRIGMFHESIQPHGTFDPDVALNHDLDLALLGDWHGPSGDVRIHLLTNPPENCGMQVLMRPKISVKLGKVEYWRLI